MKKKLMRMPKVVTILVAVLIVAIFLGSMDVAAFFLADTVSLPGYGSSMIAEFMAGVVAFLLLCLFGYFGVLGEKGKGFIHGLYTGGFLTGYCCLELAAQLYVQMMTPDAKVVSALEILFFAATMFLIGWTEELIFRGVILNVSGTFFQNEKRDSLGGHSQWCIVRGGTFDKYFTGSDGDKCDDPGDQRCLSGCDLWRCLCPVRKYLACNDFSCTGRFRKSDGQRNFWNWNNCGTDQPDVCR